MSTAEEIRKLAKLHKQGALTDEEFARKKAKLLGLSPQAKSIESQIAQTPVTKTGNTSQQNWSLFLSQVKTRSDYRLPVILFSIGSLLYLLSSVDPAFVGFAFIMQVTMGTWATLIARRYDPKLVFWPLPVLGIAFFFIGFSLNKANSREQSRMPSASVPAEAPPIEQRERNLVDSTQSELPGECALMEPDKAAIKQAVESGMTMTEAMAEASSNPDAFIAKYSLAVKGIQCIGEKVVNYGASRGNFGGSAGQAAELHRLVLSNKKSRSITMLYSHHGTKSKIIYDRVAGTLERVNETGSTASIETWREIKDAHIRACAAQGEFINNGTYNLTR